MIFRTYLESCSICDIVCVAELSAAGLPSLPRDWWIGLIMNIFLPSGRMKMSVMSNLYFCTDWDVYHYNILRDERLLILKISDSWCFRSNFYSNSHAFSGNCHTSHHVEVWKYECMLISYSRARATGDCSSSLHLGSISRTCLVLPGGVFIWKVWSVNLLLDSSKVPV